MSKYMFHKSNCLWIKDIQKRHKNNIKRWNTELYNIMLTKIEASPHLIFKESLIFKSLKVTKQFVNDQKVRIDRLKIQPQFNKCLKKRRRV